MYTVLWVLYFLQGILYPAASMVAKIILISVFIISFYRFITVLGMKKVHPYMKALNLLMFMFLIYGFFRLFSAPMVIVHDVGTSTVPGFYYLKYVFTSLGAFFPYYYYSMKGVINDSNIGKYTLLFFILAIVNYFDYQRVLLVYLTNNGVDVEGDLVNNMGYRFVPLIPLVFFLKKYKITYVVVCLVFIILGLKRGAIVCGFVMLILFFYHSFSTKKISSKRPIITALFVVVIVFGFFWYYYNASEGLRNRIEMTTEGNYSGREDLYSNAYKYLQNVGSDDLIIGGGADNSIKVLGNYSHNDWYEILMNNGLLGIILYINFLLVGVLTWIRMRRKVKDDYAASFGMYICSFILMSFFSMAINGMGPTFALGITYCLVYGSKQPSKLFSR